ncbi:MAG: hypothetical protein WDN03_10295 [Rhizomicrobium sp.]
MASDAAEDRYFYGYRLRTELPIASFPPLPREGAADIVLRHGDVPPSLDAPVWKSPFIEVDTDGCLLLKASGQLRFLIRDGRDVVADLGPNCPIQDVETFLQGTAAGVLLHQRGDLILHASCVHGGDGAVAIAGLSGRGKSTLAAGLVAHGYEAMTDDICRIAVGDGRAHAFPGPLRLRLWPDAARALSHPPESLLAGRPGHAKRLLVLPPGRCEPAPLGAIVRLGVDPRLKAPTLIRLSGPASVMPATEMLYRARLGRHLGRREGQFQDLTRLATLVPIFSLTRTGNVADLPDLVRLAASALQAHP